MWHFAVEANVARERGEVGALENGAVSTVIQYSPESDKHTSFV